MKSERDQIRAKQDRIVADLREGRLPQPVTVDPPEVVGGLIPGGYNDPAGYLQPGDQACGGYGQEPGVMDLEGVGEAVVIHNAEQLTIMADLARLKGECDEEIRAAADIASEDENLHRQAVDWRLASCARAERWIDDEGNLGWRVQISGAESDAKRFFAYIAGKLRDRGWDSTVAEALRG